MNIFKLITLCDAAEPWQLGVQDPATPTMEGMIFFHNYLIFFLIIIGTFVFWILFIVVINYNSENNYISKKFTHSNVLEIIWTIIPAIALIIVAIPSFSLLYSTEELIDPSLTLKVNGHQWYWTYEYSDFNTNVDNNIEFDSYIVNTQDLYESESTKGAFRLLEVDNRICLPINTHIRVLITAADVLHSWAIPSFGFKIDACPGRLSQGALFIKRPGIFYVQCSEICGVNHGFMPIVVRSMEQAMFKDWVSNYLLTK
jgi:cytochrome c oxidase subunit 2